MKYLMMATWVLLAGLALTSPSWADEPSAGDGTVLKQAELPKIVRNSLGKICRTKPQCNACPCEKLPCFMDGDPDMPVDRSNLSGYCTVFTCENSADGEPPVQAVGSYQRRIGRMPRCGYKPLNTASE